MNAEAIGEDNTARGPVKTLKEFKIYFEKQFNSLIPNNLQHLPLNKIKSENKHCIELLDGKYKQEKNQVF